MNIETEIKFNIDFKLKDTSFINQVTTRLNNKIKRSKNHTVLLGESRLASRSRMCFVFI